MTRCNGGESAILIASSSRDKNTWLPVAEKLTDRGHNVIAYEADKVADGRVPLDISINNQHDLTVHYDNRPLHLGSVTAAWYRRPSMFGIGQQDKAQRISLGKERGMIQKSLWASVPEQAWLNEPSRLQYAEHKLTQLALAREVGFAIPETVVTNSWRPIIDSMPNDIIFKPSQGVLEEEGGFRLAYTTPFENDANRLPTDRNPFPGFWQEYLPKAREWRITVVGDNFFDVAIYTHDSAKDDWRRHQQDNERVQFKSERFPDEQKASCLSYLGRLGLGFGIFEFVEAPDGKLTFLECNANGQYGWLEHQLGLPISDAIVDELVKKTVR